jgi:hypothetical protein
MEQVVSNLHRQIIATVVFFDIFDCPLTDWEIWKYLPQPASLLEVRLALTVLESETRVARDGGWYFLPGREELVGTRQRRYAYFDRKLRRAKWLSAILISIPWVRLVTVGNLIGDRNWRQESDIDFFIVTAPNRLWLSRLLCAGIVKILGLRPAPGRSQDKACLSFFVAADGLDLGRCRLGSAYADDPYFSYWLAGLFVLRDKDNLYRRLLAANSDTLAGLPNWPQSQNLEVAKLTPEPVPVVASWLDRVEDLAFAWQAKRLPAVIKQAAGQPGQAVLIDKKIIKLHTNDRRKTFKDEWLERLA